MAGWTPWYQPADVVIDIPLSSLDSQAAWSRAISFPAPTSDVMLEMSLASQRGANVNIFGEDLELTDVYAGTTEGAAFVDDQGNQGPNWVFGSSALPPIVGVGFAAEYNEPSGPFDPAWSTLYQTETGVATLFNQAAAYQSTALAVFEDPALETLFETSDEYQVEYRLYDDNEALPSSYVVPGSGQLLYHLDPQTDYPWNLDFYMFNPDDFPSHTAFWHAHGEVVATLLVTDNTPWDGIGILPESAFPVGFASAPTTYDFYTMMLTYTRSLRAVHREAMSLSAFDDIGPSMLATYQRTAVNGMVARVTMRPARVRFSAPCGGSRLHYLSGGSWRSIGQDDGESNLKYNDPITRSWQPVCGSGVPLYFNDQTTQSWVPLCCETTDYYDPVSPSGSGGSTGGGGADAGGGGGSDGTSGGGPGGGGDPGGGAGEGLAGAEVPPGWHQTFFDDFNGSSVDTSKWNVRNNTSNSNEQSYLLARNVTVSGSMLRITAKRESVGGKIYTSGYVDSIGKFSQKYGIWRVKAKVNTPVGTSQGVWPAPLWLRGNSCGMEIDLIETWGIGPGGGVSWYAGHEGSGSASIHQDTNGGKGKVSGWLASGAYDLSNDFHIYECEWSPTDIWVRRNGVNWVHATPSNAPWAFSGPDYGCPANMRINLQISKEGALYGAPVASTTFPTTMLIDWIQVLAQD